MPFYVPLLVSQYLDHTERYGPEKRGRVQQKFAKISQPSANSEIQLTGKTDNQ